MVSTILSLFNLSVGRLVQMQVAFTGCAKANLSVSKIFSAARFNVRWFLMHPCFASIPSAFAGYYSALKKGFYKDDDLNGLIPAGNPTHQLASEVLAGRAQYAEGNSAILYLRLPGKVFAELATIFQHPLVVSVTDTPQIDAKTSSWLNKR